MEAEMKTVLDQLATWVKDQGTAQKERSGAGGWLAGLGVAVVALIGIALLYWRDWNKGKELAKLQHEKDVALQEAKRAEALSRIKENENKIEELHARSDFYKARIVDIDKQIKTVDAVKAGAINDIDHLKNWRDVDRYLGGGDPPTPTGRAT